MASPYQPFLNSPTARQWRRIGVEKRAGVAAALFSLYSKDSAGIGEIPDLKPFIDWTAACGMSLVQLFPMNDVGFSFTPYDAESSIALEPMHLSLEALIGVRSRLVKKRAQDLRRRFPTGAGAVDYGVKRAKLELLHEIFRLQTKPSSAFKAFSRKHAGWLRPYARFKVLKERFHHSAWEQWPDEYKFKHRGAIERLDADEAGRMAFHEWLQWQLFHQFTDAKRHAARRGVFLVGDLPYLVSRDSADVWAEPEFFKLDRAAGAPPDLYFALGQRWGMPPYNWQAIAGRGYEYVTRKLRYAEHFYDLFRVDHFVGIFRVWTIALAEPPESAGQHGAFDPPDESQWAANGRAHLEAIVKSTRMLPLAEDLGVVPECSNPTLAQFAIPGMEVQRWTKDWKGNADFKEPLQYRRNSVAVLSTHDMTGLFGWWRDEAGTVDAEMFRKKCPSRGISFEKVRPKLFDAAHPVPGRLLWRPDVRDVSVLLERLGLREEQAQDFIETYRGSFDEKRRFWKFIGLPGESRREPGPELARQAILKAHEAESVFSVHPIQDWLSLSPRFAPEAADFRINYPGSSGPQNWTRRLPMSLEGLKTMRLDREILKLNRKAGRC